MLVSKAAKSGLGLDFFYLYGHNHPHEAPVMLAGYVLKRILVLFDSEAY